jgi:hypothetical protein
MAVIDGDYNYNYRYRCGQCGRGFYYKDALWTHKRSEHDSLSQRVLAKLKWAGEGTFSSPRRKRLFWLK